MTISPSAYTSILTKTNMPRIPLTGNIDLTYRCNNTCRHCWLWIPHNSPEKQEELTFDEIRTIADQARQLGTREWHISGGEPMLRPDFAEIFDYLSRKGSSYGLNTNGTLITPEIAQLMTRKGGKLIALYGATAKTYDHVTRHAGGFEKVMRGFRYLREAGASFTVQLIPMRDNWHEWEQMLALAEELSSSWRVGAPWLYKSAYGDPVRNAEIERQRLAPREVVFLDPPHPAYQEWLEEATGGSCQTSNVGSVDQVFNCIRGSRAFHIDPYGKMSWCFYIKEPAMRYDLRRGSLQEGWDVFIPSLEGRIRPNNEWREHCGSCKLKADCRSCAAFNYLETGSYTAPLLHLCAAAKEAQAYKARWFEEHRRYFKVAGLDLQLESAESLKDIRFNTPLAALDARPENSPQVTLQHYFDLAGVKNANLGEVVYDALPWIVSRQQSGKWIYRYYRPDKESSSELLRVAVFNPDHTHGVIYSTYRDYEIIREGGWDTLSLFPDEQPWLAPVLANRGALLLRASVMPGMQGTALVAGADAEIPSASIRLPGDVELQLSSSSAAEPGCIVTSGRIIPIQEANPLTEHASLQTARTSAVPELQRATNTGASWMVSATWSNGSQQGPIPFDSICFIDNAQGGSAKPLSDPEAIQQRLKRYAILPVVSGSTGEMVETLIRKLAAEVICFVV